MLAGEVGVLHKSYNRALRVGVGVGVFCSDVETGRAEFFSVLQRSIHIVYIPARMKKTVSISWTTYSRQYIGDGE